MSNRKNLPAAAPDTLVKFDEFGGFEITDDALLDLVAAGFAVSGATTRAEEGYNGNCKCINSKCNVPPTKTPGAT